MYDALCPVCGRKTDGRKRTAVAKTAEAALTLQIRQLELEHQKQAVDALAAQQAAAATAAMEQAAEQLRAQTAALEQEERAAQTRTKVLQARLAELTALARARALGAHAPNHCRRLRAPLLPSLKPNARPQEAPPDTTQEAPPPPR